MFEATPLQVANAYTIFPNGGTTRPLRALSRIVSGGQDLQIVSEKARTIARADTTFLVTNMMRSVINEAGSCRAGQRIRARRGGQVGHDQRSP